MCQSDTRGFGTMCACRLSIPMQQRDIDELSPLDRLSPVAFRRIVAGECLLPGQGRGGGCELSVRISGDECARALEQCGLVRFDEGAGVVWMEHGATFVCVPRCDSLPTETLVDILATIGLSTRDFVKTLDRWPNAAMTRRQPPCGELSHWDV